MNRVAIKKISRIILGDQDLPKDEFDKDAAQIIELYLSGSNNFADQTAVSEYLAELFNEMYGYGREPNSVHGFKFYGPEFENHAQKIIKTLQTMKRYIFTNKYKDEYHPECIVTNLEDILNGLEFGDVNEGVYQIWEYPNGKIYDLIPSSTVSDKDYYLTPGMTGKYET